MKKKIIQVLTIKQPWVYAFIVLGKDIENRSWPTDYRGKIYLHAGSTFDMDGYKYLIQEGLIPEKMLPKYFKRGGILAKANLVDCVTKSKSAWFNGEYGFQLNNVERVNFIPCKGKLGIWTLEI